MSHLDPDTLDALAYQLLDVKAAAKATAHLAHCEACMSAFRSRANEANALRDALTHAPKRGGVWRLGAVAAVLVLLVGVAWLVAGRHVERSKFPGSADPVRTFRLGDGTEVIAATPPRVEDWRTVQLGAGEYYFDVASAAGIPFRIHTDSGQIRVLGTRFRVNLEEKPMNGTVVAVLAVTVVGGAVVLFNDHGSETLGPGDRGEIVGTQAPSVTRVEGDVAIPQLEGESPQARIARLEASLEEAKREIRQLRDTETAEHVSVASPPDDLDPERLRSEFNSLLQKTYSGQASEEDMVRLSEFTKRPELMRALVSDLEARIAENPGDLDARIELVRVDSARLHASAGSIAERTHLGKRIVGQINEVLERDPENWDGLYQQAMATSHGRRDVAGQAEALRQFRHLQELQERGTPEARHSATYIQLAMLYASRNEQGKALATLRAGQKFLPDDSKLRELEARLER